MHKNLKENICLEYYRIFLKLMETAELTKMLKQEGAFTIFAPTDDAFRDLTENDMKLLTSKPASTSYRDV